MGEAKRKRQAAMAQEAAAPTPRELTLPERVANDSVRRAEGIWKVVEQIRKKPSIVEGADGPWEPWCYFPVNVMAGAVAMVTDTPPDEVEQSWTGVTRMLCAIAGWRMTKGVYIFDPDVLKALLDSEVDDELPDEMFLRLPEWCPYIATPGVQMMPGLFMHGFFGWLDDRAWPDRRHPPELNFEVLVDPQKSADDWLFAAALLDIELRAEAVHLMNAEKFDQQDPETVREFVVSLARKREYLHFHMNLPLGQGSFVKAFREHTAGVAKILPEKDSAALLKSMEHEKAPEVMEMMAGLQARLGSLLLYLVSDRADVPEGLTQARDAVRLKERQGIRNFQAPNIRQWEVGFRIGAQIREFEQRERGDATGTGPSLRPHVRKAHWHSFWTGPRDKPEQRGKRVRWLPPIPVNVETSDDLVPTVHKVDKEPRH